jgi:hypothetical protein
MKPVLLNRQLEITSAANENKPALTDSNFVDIDNYVFQSDFPKSKSRKAEKKKREDGKNAGGEQF